VNTDQVNELYVDLQKEILDCITEDEKELKSEMAVEEADKRKNLFWSSKSDSLRGAYSKFEDGICEVDLSRGCSYEVQWWRGSTNKTLS
jgi:hypothetical protein